MTRNAIILAIALCALVLSPVAARAQQSPLEVVQAYYADLTAGDERAYDLATPDSAENIRSSLEYYRQRNQYMHPDISGLNYELIDQKTDVASVKVFGQIILTGDLTVDSIDKGGKKVPVTGGGREVINVDHTQGVRLIEGRWLVWVKKR